MPAMRMKTVCVESASYDEIKDAVESPVPPTAEVSDLPPVAEVEPVEEKHANDVTDDFTEVKAKKQAPMATCEWCGKNMTAKNLKYSHKPICPSRPRDEETPAAEEPAVEEPPADDQPAKAPPKPKLKRAVTVTDEVSEQEPPSEAKPKSKPRAKPKAKPSETQSEAAPPVRRSKAVAKAELYEQLVANALS